MIQSKKRRVLLLLILIHTGLFYGFVYFSGGPILREQEPWKVTPPDPETFLDNSRLAKERYVEQLESSSSTPILYGYGRRRPFKILFWTKWYDKVVEFEDDFTRTQCAEDFLITSNKSEVDEADIIVFQYGDLLRNQTIPLPHPRKDSVPWVLAVQEAPNNIGSLAWDLFNGQFNWTWSYRTSSEIHPVFKDMFPEVEEPHDKKKSKLVAWVVSNCHLAASKRKEFVEELEMNGIAVDIFGECENATSCPGSGEDCFRKLGETYKFYLAAENSLCVDYITEKIHHGLSHNMVPILFGMGKRAVIAPPHSYIDALAFSTVAELADQIKALDEEEMEYFYYFEWRRYYNVDTGFPLAATYHCSMYKRMRQLVEKLKDGGDEIRSGKIAYGNLKVWFQRYYRPEVMLSCDVCVPSFRVNVTHPIANKLICTFCAKGCKAESVLIKGSEFRYI